MPPRKKAPAKKKAASKSRSSSRRKKGRSISVDFTDVETRVTLPEDDYRLVVEHVEEEEGGEYPYLRWKFKTVHSQSNLNNKTVYNNTSLAPQALWNLRNLLEALGVETPDSAYDLDLDSVEGLEMVGSIEHEEYENDEGEEKTRMQLADYMPLTDGFEESSGSGVVDDDDEDEDEDDDDDADDDDGDEDDDDDGDDGDGDEEDITEEEVQDMNVEDLNEVIEAYELDVDFKGMRSLRKKQNAVIDALKEAGYIDE